MNGVHKQSIEGTRKAKFSLAVPLFTVTTLYRIYALLLPARPLASTSFLAVMFGVTFCSCHYQPHLAVEPAT